jgi:nucleoside-diphosphate-sugar epimerase
MRTLITGGCGFIGSHVAQRICEKGGQVVVLDDLSSGNEANLCWKTDREGMEVVIGDVNDDGLLSRLVPSCQNIIHLAAIPSVAESIAHPLHTHRVNLDATLKLLVLAREHHVERFIHISSCAVYGNEELPVKVEEGPLSPISPYAVQKLAGEYYARTFFRLFGLPTVSLRLFNVYGPRQASDSDYAGVIAKFCHCAINGESPVVFGDGLQTRDFVYVEDVVAAITACLEVPLENIAGRCFNIGAGKSCSLLDLIGSLGDLAGRRLSPRFVDGRSGDVRRSQASIDAAQKYLFYQPEFELNRGLGLTLEFYRRQLSLPPNSPPAP